MNFQKDGKHLVEKLFERVPDRDGILHSLGLERRRHPVVSSLPAAGTFLAGLAIGGGVALWLYPRFGRQIRKTIEEMGQRAGLSVLGSGDDAAADRSSENGRSVVNSKPTKVAPVS